MCTVAVGPATSFLVGHPLSDQALTRLLVSLRVTTFVVCTLTILGAYELRDRSLVTPRFPQLRALAVLLVSRGTAPSVPVSAGHQPFPVPFGFFLIGDYLLTKGGSLLLSPPSKNALTIAGIDRSGPMVLLNTLRCSAKASHSSRVCCTVS